MPLAEENWTADEARAIYPSYRMERARLLSNLMCMKRLERRGFDTRPKMWHEPSSLLIKRDLLDFRNRWSGVRRAIARSEAEACEFIAQCIDRPWCFERKVCKRAVLYGITDAGRVALSSGEPR